MLDVEGLTVSFRNGATRADVVRAVDLHVAPGEVVGIAGESGSGKTTVALTAMGLLASNASVQGSVRYRDRELVGADERELRSLRGRAMAMIFQETTSALNPVMRVGDQLTAAVRAHDAVGKKDARRRVMKALAEVQLHDPARVFRSYPHQLSGGMCQRVMIAMALGCGSRLLFADEPTTALDVSVQREILRLLRSIVESREIGLVMISHDLAVLADICDRIAVMYRGEVVETGPASQVLGRPAHPYTVGLLDALPRLREPGRTLPEISGDDPSPDDTGCRFASRCAMAGSTCARNPSLVPVPGSAARRSRCWFAESVLDRGVGERPDHVTVAREDPAVEVILEKSCAVGRKHA